MGQPKGGGTSSGGGGGGGSSAPKKKKDNGTSKYFKSTSKPVAKTPSAKTLAEQYGLKGAGEAAAKTKAVATPAAKATPKKTVKAKPPAAPKVSVIKAPTISAAPAAKIEAAPAKESFGVLKSDTAAKRDTTSATFIKDVTKRAIPKAIASISEPDALSAKPKVDAASVREKAYEKAAEPKAGPTIGEKIGGVIKNLASGGIVGEAYKAITADKYRNDEPSYNQAYWAKRRAEVGADQAAKEVKAVGLKKAYSGDVVVTPDSQRRAQDDLKRITGSMAVLDNLTDLQKKQMQVATTKTGGIQPFLDVGGVTKTVSKPTGLFGETQQTDYQYADRTSGQAGTKITTKTTDPVIKTPLGDLRLGKKKSTTYVDGVEVATKTGGDELGVGAKVAQAEAPAHIADTTKIEPMDGLNTVEDVQKAIESTTDKKELASLHERLRSLMRAMRTRTKFGGLAIGQAETEATKLGGLRIK